MYYVNLENGVSFTEHANVTGTLNCTRVLASVQGDNSCCCLHFNFKKHVLKWFTP